MAFEWVAGLFQSDNQQTRGLSGDQAHSVALDDANSYYNFRLRRHRAEGDVIGDASLLWYTSPYVKRREGLGTHVGADIGDGQAGYTDVMLILSREDFLRATPDWQEAATRALQQEFDTFCRRENFTRVHPHRPLGVRILEDGSAEMFGQSLGLGRGEFVTGLLPNLYTGPVRGSWPVIGVHLNLPSVWQGYQEVGRLYNDQMLFTLGNHWLDNFSHPSLQQAALYRLRQYPDGTFIHIINPDLHNQYQVTSTNQGGASVLTLATRADGVPLAYIVLAVIDPPAQAPRHATPDPREGRTGAPARPSGDHGARASGGVAPASGPSALSSPVPPPRRPDAAAGRNAPLGPGIRMPKPPPTQRDSVPSIAPPMMIDDVAPTKIGLGGKTIIPDAPSERILTLQERGALLQKVHFSAFMLGYDVYLGTRGELATHVENPAATFQVRKRTVSLVSHIDGVVIDGKVIPAGVEVPIEGDVKIEVAGQKLEYRDLRVEQADGWPYVGEIRRPASSTYVIWGEDYQIGRSRECRVVLPDEPRNDNIHWKPSVGDGATIRARTGEIPKARFYTDSIMVASEHASIDLRTDQPRVVCTARHCYVYVRRNDQVQALYPTTSPQLPKDVDLLPGDEILIGNCLFQVGYTAGEAVEPAPAPKVELTPGPGVPEAPTPPPRTLAESLSGAVSAPDLAALDSDTVPPAPVRSAPPPLPGPAASAEPPPAPAPPEPDPQEPSNGVAVGGRVESTDMTSTSRPLDSDGWLQPPARRRRSTAPTAPAVADPVPPEVPVVEPPTDPTGDPPSLPPDPDGWNTVPTDRFDDEVADVGGWDLADWDADAAPEGALPLPDGPPPLPEAPEPWDPALGREPSALEPVLLGEPVAPELPAQEGPNRLDWSDPDDDDDLSVDSPPATDERVLAPTPPQPVEPDAPLVAEPVSGGGREEPQQPDLGGRGEVLFIDDTEAQFEIGRPIHLVLAGWAVNGEVVCGNHAGCDLRLPENRIRPDQTLTAREYFRLRVRGSRGTLDVLAPSEVEVDGGAPAPSYADPAAHTIEVLRRDDMGERDFTVVLRLVEDRRLPDPRSRFVAIDTEDPLARALVTRGLPKGAPRTLSLDGIALTFLFDGAAIRVSDYLPTYRRGDGFHPFFVQRGDERFRTADEDGAPFELHPGDRLVIGPCVYELRRE